jgi:adenosylhomocysteinase
VECDIADKNLAPQGVLKVERAENDMPVLSIIGDRYEKERPLDGVRIGACLHVTSETANLMRVLKRGGAEAYLCASNPLSTQDEVAAALVEEYGIPTFSICGEDNDTYYGHIRAVLDAKPQITMDDGADLVSMLHTEGKGKLGDVIGGTEETTTGVIRLRSMENEGVLSYPIIAVNDAQTKHLFDNRYGTGQSTIDGILRATNKLLAGCRFVVCGYGWCGRGIAARARGMGSHVYICEVSPLRALQATMDGYSVVPIAEAAAVGDIFVTATGDKGVIRAEHVESMKDGAIVCNSGHFNVEIDIPRMRELAASTRKTGDQVEEFTLKNGSRIYLLAEGRLVNLSAAEGHPSAVMDMSFANQALSAKYVAENRGKLEKKVYTVPEELDSMVARMKLESMGVGIDTLTQEQEKYLAGWQEGT